MCLHCRAMALRLSKNRLPAHVARSTHRTGAFSILTRNRSDLNGFSVHRPLIDAPPSAPSATSSGQRRRFCLSHPGRVAGGVDASRVRRDFGRNRGRKVMMACTKVAPRYPPQTVLRFCESRRAAEVRLRALAAVGAGLKRERILMLLAEKTFSTAILRGRPRFAGRWSTSR